MSRWNLLPLPNLIFFFEKVLKEVFNLCWLSRFFKLNPICDEVDSSALDGLSIFGSSSDYRETKTKVFDQDGQISGFVEENLSLSRKNGVKSELFATCLFEEKILSSIYFDPDLHNHRNFRVKNFFLHLFSD